MSNYNPLSKNPNINPGPGPPPPLNQHHHPSSSQNHPHTHSQSTTVEHTQTQAPIYAPPLALGISGPPPILPGIGFGVSPFAPSPFLPGPSAMDPSLFLPSPNSGMQGPLAPIKTGNFIPGSMGGIGYGLHGGVVGGLPIPPPPPGAVGGVLAPFAPMGPLWGTGGGVGGGGLAFGNVPASVGGLGVGMPGLGVGIGGMIPPMSMGMGLGMIGGLQNTMHNRPAPLVHDSNLGFPAQPAQQETTQIAGGIPPGVTLIEPAEHSIVINIKGNICPWLSPGASYDVEPLALSSSTGLNRLIQVCNGGVPDDECENLAITECIELGNGLWEKGQTFKFDEAVSRVLTMKDAGWDNKRNRTGGESCHLWGHRI